MRQAGKQLNLASIGLAVFAPVALALALLASPGAANYEENNGGGSLQVEVDKISSDLFYNALRKRSGYFHEFPVSDAYSQIYTQYFEHVVQVRDDSLSDKKISPDDWRRFRPTPELCLEFLIGLQVRQFVLSKPYEIIPLDACLYWLHAQPDEKKVDISRMRRGQIKELNQLEQDPTLRSIFESTKFKNEGTQQTAKIGVPENIRQLVYKYLIELLKVFKESPTNGCHSLWLEAYNNFVEDVMLIDCSEDDESKCVRYGYAHAWQDSYLRMIGESTIAAGQSCYRVMQKQMHGLLDAEYEASNTGLPTTLAKRFKSSKNRVAKQSQAKRWSREMIGILQIVSNTDADQPINLGKCAVDLERIKENEPETVRKFTDALANYALEASDMTKNANDPNGRGRYGRAVTKLCRPYTDPKDFLSSTAGIGDDNDDEQVERKPFEFYHIIYSLVRITNHEPIFAITKDQFEEDVIKNGWEALYLATFACQIISITWGEVTHEANSAAFEVSLRPNYKNIILDWPIELMTERLPHIYPPESGRDSIIALPQGALFGRKLKLFGRNSNSNSSSNNDNDKAPEPAPAARQYSSFKSEPQQLASGPLEQTSSQAQNQQQPQVPGEPSQRASKFSKLFGKQRRQQVDQQAAAPLAAASAHQLGGPAAAEKKPVVKLSDDTIETFKQLHGRLPKFSQQYMQSYPDTPNDPSGAYPKTLGLKPLFQDPATIKSKSSLYSSPEWQGTEPDSKAASKKAADQEDEDEDSRKERKRRERKERRDKDSSKRKHHRRERDNDDQQEDAPLNF